MFFFYKNLHQVLKNGLIEKFVKKLYVNNNLQQFLIFDCI